MNKYCEISLQQEGFLKGKSSNTLMNEFTQPIQSILEYKLTETGIFKDLSEALDIVDHKMLLRKLDFYGTFPP